MTKPQNDASTDANDEKAADNNLNKDGNKNGIKDFDRVENGIFVEKGASRRDVDAQNKELKKDKFDIICLSPQVAKDGLNPLVFGPTDYEGLSYKGVTATEIQNEDCDNAFDLFMTDKKEKILTIHTMTIGNSFDDSGNSLGVSYVVHPHYWDTTALVKVYFNLNADYDAMKPTEGINIL